MNDMEKINCTDCGKEMYSRLGKICLPCHIKRDWERHRLMDEFKTKLAEAKEKILIDKIADAVVFKLKESKLCSQ